MIVNTIWRWMKIPLELLPLKSCSKALILYKSDWMIFQMRYSKVTKSLILQRSFEFSRQKFHLLVLMFWKIIHKKFRWNIWNIWIFAPKSTVKPKSGILAIFGAKIQKFWKNNNKKFRWDIFQHIWIFAPKINSKTKRLNFGYFWHENSNVLKN